MISFRSATCIAGVGLACFAVGTQAHAAPTVRTPSLGECSWQEHGFEVEHADGSRFVCHCERVVAIAEVWCAWQELPVGHPPVGNARKAKRAAAKAKPRVRVYPKPSVVA